MIRVDNFNTQRYNNNGNYIDYRTNQYNKSSVNFGNSNTTNTNLNNKPIKFDEGMQILWEGIKQQCISTAKEMFENPKCLLGLVGITAGLSILPIIGIPTAVGGSALAVGFATFATIKTTKHCLEFAKNNRNEEYDIARKNLETIGEDTVDLALSLPFVPKSITKLKTFAKYGKIGINKELFNQKKFSEVIDTVTNPKYNAELERSIYFKQATAQELKSIKNLSPAELKTLKQELTDYNVEYDKLPEVVLEKWAQKYNIHTKPQLEYQTLPEFTAGKAIGNTCTIIINDNKARIPAVDKYKTLEIKKTNDTYKFTFLDKETNKTIVEEIAASIVDKYNELQKAYKNLSPELKRIIVTIHEREHIDQYARIVIEKGLNTMMPTEMGKNIYQAMTKEMISQPRTAEKAAETARMIAQKPLNGTFTQYLKSPLEIGAREAEMAALKDPLYTHLDNICKTVNSKNPNASLTPTYILNTLRMDSLAS